VKIPSKKLPVPPFFYLAIIKRTMDISKALLHHRKTAPQFYLGECHDAKFLMYEWERDELDLWFYKWGISIDDGLRLIIHDLTVGMNHGVKLIDVRGFRLRYFEFLDERPSKETIKPIRYSFRCPKRFDLRKLYGFYFIPYRTNKKHDPEREIMALSTLLWRAFIKMGILPDEDY